MFGAIYSWHLKIQIMQEQNCEWINKDCNMQYYIIGFERAGVFGPHRGAIDFLSVAANVISNN